jgi:TnpA family transposase
LKTCSSSEVAAVIEGLPRHDTEMQFYFDSHGPPIAGARGFLMMTLARSASGLEVQNCLRPSGAMARHRLFHENSIRPRLQGQFSGA